ncbi:MAG TPA: 30S ribosomal protein S8 [bacterium]|jgi:small subunit ribosomal protein S8|nr:MAG: 30S ribosomal protein S8 [Parcubacteria group bacterium ADurb.Bin115]HNU81124.1 30S ribosomal protein S8 [bacterium]HOD86726.1 30S ribosomal protein S8 [bacterium]HPW05714.1 30S ribosomal protein S8 [bacterium]HPY99792.1 30S ribosomal protein S8 [bacterium]
MTDSIADMFTRIRNASAIKQAEVLMPMSKIKYEIAKILEREGWISHAEIVAGGLNARRSQFDQLKIVLKYHKNGNPVISNIKRISKAGSRVYVGKENIPTVLNNFGMAIISTSSGLMTNREAYRQKIGGEVVGEVY